MATTSPSWRQNVHAADRGALEPCSPCGIQERYSTVAPINVSPRPNRSARSAQFREGLAAYVLRKARRSFSVLPHHGGPFCAKASYVLLRRSQIWKEC